MLVVNNSGYNPEYKPKKGGKQNTRSKYIRQITTYCLCQKKVLRNESWVIYYQALCFASLWRFVLQTSKKYYLLYLIRNGVARFVGGV